MSTKITTDHGRWVCFAVALISTETEAKEAGNLKGLSSKHIFYCSFYCSLKVSIKNIRK